jgi:toxin ParE1/3/4
MPNVRYIPEARRDMKEIGRFIAEQSRSLEISRNYLMKIRERCVLHATHPEMGTLRPDINHNVRCFSIDNYVVYFRPIPNGVEVLLVTHGSREAEGLLRQRIQ